MIFAVNVPIGNGWPWLKNDNKYLNKAPNAPPTKMYKYCKVITPLIKIYSNK